MKNIFIIGSKGIPANYGGFETFVEKLTEKKISNDIMYHVSCLSDNYDEFEHNGARCFNIKVPSIGAAKAVYYDIFALKKVIKYIKENNIQEASVYILACRIGPFIGLFKKQLSKLSAKLYVNPDGHEWKRGKWNFSVRKYWKISERFMVKHADILVCDSKNIQKYIEEDYKIYKPKTKFIAYGADIEKSKLSNNDNLLIDWYRKNDIREKEYYLVVGRFVPENNYEIMIREFMKSKTRKDLIIVTNVEENKFYEELKISTRFDIDRRIKFVGTVYNQELLKKIREKAYAYIHGHEVGGTNPSLLEALATTDLNILLDVGFNREVAKDGAVYFSKKNDGLLNIINNEKSLNEIENLSIKAKERIKLKYSWNKICSDYENLFLEDIKEN